MADQLTPKQEENIWKFVSEESTQNKAAHDRIAREIEELAKLIHSHVLSHAQFDQSLQNFLDGVESIKRDQDRNWLWNGLLVGCLMGVAVSIYHWTVPGHWRTAELQHETSARFERLESRLERLEVRIDRIELEHSRIMEDPSL